MKYFVKSDFVIIVAGWLIDELFNCRIWRFIGMCVGESMEIQSNVISFCKLQTVQKKTTQSLYRLAKVLQMQTLIMPLCNFVAGLQNYPETYFLSFCNICNYI